MELVIEPGQSLGLMIRGGIEYGLGIYVTGVDKDSVADHAGLNVSAANTISRHNIDLNVFSRFLRVTRRRRVEN